MSAAPLRVFDGHNDLLYQLRYSESGGEDWFVAGREEGHIDLPRLRQSDFGGGLFALYARRPDFDPDQWEMRPGPEGGYAVDEQPAVPAEWARSEVLHELATALRLLRRLPDDLQLVLDAGGLEAAASAGRIAVVLHLEGADGIGPDLDELEVLYAAGLRSLGLVWSRPNEFAAGVPFRFPASPDTGPGLTAAGRRLVNRCGELGVQVDLAHLNERGFWDVAEISSRPLVVSHADVHAIAPSTRNLTDRQLDAIGESGGIVGINLSVRDLRADGRDDPDVPIDVVAEHVEYVAERIGVDHVGLGSDLDGATVPNAIGDVRGLGAILERLRERGCGEGEVAKIAHGNWHRVLAAAWSR